jgi:pyridoxamine 5'-phosphate oxidase
MEITAESNPIAVFEAWLKEAAATGKVREPTAMALATLASDGAIHNRIVLCKEFSAAGLTFFTNYCSPKGVELAAHPKAGAVFYWDPLHRQVRVSGSVHKLSVEESRAYWQTRPRDSQLSQLISEQSSELKSRDDLERKWQHAESEYEGREIPCPSHWGGYRMEPETIEFWIGRPGRLHDRFQFEKSQKVWTFRRLYP